jgi:hypothetical protein
VSEGTQQTETIFCNTCNTVTDHLLRARYSTPRIESVNENDPDPVRHAYKYSLWSCAGCKDATLEKQGASEDSDSEWAEASGEYYPRRMEDSIQPKVFKNLNSELSRLYKEIVACFNEDCLLLCTIGLRALIEGVCNDKGFKDRKLEINIEGLTKLLPPNMIEALHALRLFGNDAAHRLEALTRGKAHEAIGVMEHLLNHFYDMDYRASQVKHPEKVAFDSLKPGSVQLEIDSRLSRFVVTFLHSPDQTGRASQDSGRTHRQVRFGAEFGTAR